MKKISIDRHNIFKVIIDKEKMLTKRFHVWTFDVQKSKGS